MSAPMIHAQASAKRFGGEPGNYLDIHVLMDSTKATFADNRHRALTHNIWFVAHVIPLIFGQQRTNSAGKTYSCKDVAEYHVLEDFRMKYIPTVQDYLENMEMKDWMQNGAGVPNSAKKLYKKKEKETKEEPTSTPPGIEIDITDITFPPFDIHTGVLDGRQGRGHRLD